MKSPLIARQRSRSPRRDVVVVVVVRPTCAVPLAVFSEKQARAYGIFSRYPRRSGAPRHRQSSRSFPTVALVSLFPLPSLSVSLSLLFFLTPPNISLSAAQTHPRRLDLVPLYIASAALFTPPHIPPTRSRTTVLLAATSAANTTTGDAVTRSLLLSRSLRRCCSRYQIESGGNLPLLPRLSARSTLFCQKLKAESLL